MFVTLCCFTIVFICCLVLPGFDFRLWWECNDWLLDLVDQLGKPKENTLENEPQFGDLFEPVLFYLLLIIILLSIFMLNTD